ncbi:MAG: Obg family GTPase CgtA, partial [Erysipelotrichaceae bacterium]
EKPPFSIKVINEHSYQLEGDDLERLFLMSDIKTDIGAARLARKLKEMGVDDALRKHGAVNGDTIYIREFQFTFID